MSTVIEVAQTAKLTGKIAALANDYSAIDSLSSNERWELIKEAAADHTGISDEVGLRLLFGSDAVFAD